MVSRLTSVCLSVRQSAVRPSVVSFPDDHLSKHQWIFLVCTLILWRSGLGLLMGKFCQILTVICPRHAQFSFPDDNSSKHQWIFTKLGLCIDIVEIRSSNEVCNTAYAF